MKPSQRALYLLSLILAGESIYMLVYVRKTFQTSMESVLQLSSAEIGLLNSVFGLFALLCYFPGGWIADRFSARNLLIISLVATALGGFYMHKLPDFNFLIVLYAYWGVVTVLTFWAPLIKATRYWGTPQEQGRTFGLLDAGRGVVDALLVSCATFLFSQAADIQSGFLRVINLYAIACLLAAVCVWFFIPDVTDTNSRQEHPWHGRENLAVLLSREVWLLALIIFASYFLYVGTFELAAYAERGFGQTKTDGALLSVYRDWLRPIAAISAGIVADKIKASRLLGLMFFVLMMGFASMSVMPEFSEHISILWLQTTLIAIAVFALRAVYFALLAETNIPLSATGTVVGLVSFIGFMPDTFAHVLAGHLVDNYGILGYQFYFACLALVALVGLLATMVIIRSTREKT